MDKDNSQLSKQLRTIKHLKKEAQKSASALTQQTALNTPSMRTMDASTMREYHDLKLQYDQMDREFNTANANLIKNQREFRIHEIGKAEVESLPDGSNCYRGIGKIFLKATKEGATEYLDKKMEEKKKKEADLTQKLEYLERRIKSTEKNMEELISSAS